MIDSATMHRETALRLSRSLILLLIAGSSIVMLAGCGGGAQTTENPITSVTPPSTYNGPPPQTADIQNFKLNVWDNIQAANRCGGCHAQGGQGNGYFARNDDINIAYEAANLVADLVQPDNSLLVSKVGQGHNCWLTDNQACADIMTTWIEGWAGATSGSGRQITLTAPTPVDPGDSRSYANADVNDFVTWVHDPILTTYCAGCHNSQSPTSQQPYFAEADANVAFEAAKPRMDINDPVASRFVIRLGSEFHNCWSADCAADAAQMQTAISNFAATIPITQLDPALVNSKALRLIDGTLASGGNRYEGAQIGLWEFKTGTGTMAFDTSGVEPAINLQLIGDVEWFGGWGITINDGRAQGDTTSSKKLHDLIKATGEYSIEAWVVPNNVTQEMSRIVTYSGGDTALNFTLEQNLYDYDFRHRSETSGPRDLNPLSTPDADEVLQATLQHVVATYGPVDGRRIYVNGNLVTPPDAVQTTSMADWQSTFAFVLGNEASGNGLWQGTLRLVAIHNRELTPAQIVQNFDVGVGEKFYMLFGIEDIISVPTAYILFEVSQFDNYAYLFTQPHFITLDTNQQPQDIPIQGMRVGINGAEVAISQSYANVDDILDYQQFAELGQPLSPLGAVIPLERGPADDEFFLTFDLLGSESYVRTDDPPLVITESDLLPPAQRIGMRTFDEINATMSAVTGVSTEEFFVDVTFQSLRQSLPAIEDPSAFLSSHQVAIAQLAIEYCNALIEDQGTISTAVYFPGFDFNAAPGIAYGNRDALITPLIDNIVGIALTTQPDTTDVENELGYNTFDPVTLRPDNLIDRLIAGGTDTRSIAKGACAAVLGSGAMLVQ